MKDTTGSGIGKRPACPELWPKKAPSLKSPEQERADELRAMSAADLRQAIKNASAEDGAAWETYKTASALKTELLAEGMRRFLLDPQ